MKILITGGCGFLGSNLASRAIDQGDELVLFDNLSRYGSRLNLDWLSERGDFRFVHGDISNRSDIERVVSESSPEVIFHLAGQVAMTTSILEPLRDFEVNALGTVLLLEAVRKYSPDAVVVYSSTNKVYGDLAQFTYKETSTRYECIEYPDGFDETTPLEFHSPYGCSKGSADQYMLDYARIFGLNTIVLRHSSMYGGRQFSTCDQGWVGWFCQQAVNVRQNILKEPVTISGNGKQVRDLLHADDMISLYYSTVRHIDRGRGKAFNIGGGIDNSLSLLELFSLITKIYGIELSFLQLPPRESDQKFFVANISHAIKVFEWTPLVDKRTGVKRMLDWIEAGAE